MPSPKANLLQLAMHRVGPIGLQCPAQYAEAVAYKYMHTIICQISELMVFIYFI